MDWKKLIAQNHWVKSSDKNIEVVLEVLTLLFQAEFSNYEDWTGINFSNFNTGLHFSKHFGSALLNHRYRCMHFQVVTVQKPVKYCK